MRETEKKHNIAIEVITEADIDVMNLKYGIEAKRGIYCVSDNGKISWHDLKDRDFLIKYGYLILPVNK